MSRRLQDVEKAERIKNVMFETRSVYVPKYTGDDYDGPPPDCDEVYPNLFIGDRNAALNKSFLRRKGITHVVNAAAGRGFGQVNTDSNYYRDVGIRFMGLNLVDLSVTNVSIHFETVADFIENAIRGNGKVLVHCYMGVSRSAVLALAYLVLKCNMSACTAMALARRRRNIHPNDGFIYQLAVLDNKIMRRQESDGLMLYHRPILTTF